MPKHTHKYAGWYFNNLSVKYIYLEPNRGKREQRKQTNQKNVNCYIISHTKITLKHDGKGALFNLILRQQENKKYTSYSNETYTKLLSQVAMLLWYVTINKA